MKRRICLVAATTAAGHGELPLAWLRGLRAAGWDARLLCTGERSAGNPASLDPALAANVEVVPGRDWYPPLRSLLGHPGELARRLGMKGGSGPFDRPLLKLRPSLIHFHSAIAAREALRLKRVLGCRLATSLDADGRDLDHPDLEALWIGADLLVFPDPVLRDRAIARGCPAEKAEVLPIPLRSPKPALDGPRPEPGPLRLFSAGPLTWEQGLEHSIHAVRHLLDLGTDFRYRILGQGDHLYAVGFARHQLELEENIELLSSRDGSPLEEELRAADVIVDPAVTETTPLAPLAMAQALGTPFVATHRAGLPEDGGITVRRRKPTEVAEALATLAADPALRRQMGEAGRAQVGRYPTFDDHVLRLDQLYRRILD